MIPATINQALDKMLTKYKQSELTGNPTLKRWKDGLLLAKRNLGGNYKLDEPEKINHVIETGQEN